MRSMSIWGSVLIHFVMMFLSSYLCETKPRDGVIITGTTVGPSFQRNEGKLAGRCPDSHPWAFNNGTLCCLNFHQSGNVNTDLDWHDAENMCPDGNHVPCSVARCRSNDRFIDPLSCPQDHPIQMENACCWSYRRKADSNCDGGLIAKDDPAICCPDEKLCQPPDCQQFKRKCIAFKPENVRTYCPLQPERRRLSTEDFSYSTNHRHDIPLLQADSYCKAVGGSRMPLTNGSLTDALQLLKDPQVGVSPQDLRTYVIGAVKVRTEAACNSKASCNGKILNLPNSDPVDFDDGFTDKISTFAIPSNAVRSIALDIRVDTSFVRVKTINVAKSVGSFLCQIQCLD